MIGCAIASVFSPLCCGTWGASTAILTGLTAKEAVVSTLAVLMGAGDEAGLAAMLSRMFTPVSAFSFLCFVLLYMPCVAAFAAMRREMGSTLKSVPAMAAQTGVAWIMAFVIYHIALLIV